MYNNPELMHRDNIVVPLNITADNDYQYYPNPANDLLNLSLISGTFEPGTIVELYDITGKQVYNATIGSNTDNATVNIKEIKQGLYLCVVKNSKEIISSFKISVAKQ